MTSVHSDHRDFLLLRLLFAVDHLVNNASIWQVCKFEEVEDVNYFRALMVHSHRPFFQFFTQI